MSSSLSSVAVLPGPALARPARARRPPRLGALSDVSSGNSAETAAHSATRQQQQQHAQQPPAAAAAAAASSNGATPPPLLPQQQPPSIQHPIFPEPQQPATVPLPVQTQRGLPLFRPVLGDPPCPACAGTGKTTCGDCRGKGRLNYRSAAMLPPGVKPQWCPSCRASGRWCCASCMGTGVRRGPIGFRLPHEDDS